MRRLWIVLVILVLLLAIGVVPRVMQRHSLVEAATRAAAPPRVFVVRAQPSRDSSVLLPGSLVAVEQVAVNARSSGYVARYYADIGQRVKAGQVLADIQAPDVEAQYRQARAQTSQAEAATRQAESGVAQLMANLEQSRAQRESTAGALLHARATLQSYQAKVLEAVRAYQQAEANLKLDHSQMVLAQRTYARYKTLGLQGYVTQQDVDQYQAAYESAVSKVEADEDAVRNAEATIADARASAQSAVSDVASAQANLRAADDNIQAAKSALASGRHSVASAQANVEASRQNEKRYFVLQGFEKVVAPFDGVVTARNVDVGSLVNLPAANVSDTGAANTVPVNALFGVARLDPLEIDVQLPQTFVTGIAPGEAAAVTVRELPQEKFEGQVFAVSGALDSASRTALTRIRVPNPQGRLRPGMYAEVTVSGRRGQPVLQVPSTALIYDSAGTRLATVTNDNRIHLQPIQVGRDFGNEIEVPVGITADSWVVASPSDTLKEGMAVQPVAEKKP